MSAMSMEQRRARHALAHINSLATCGQASYGNYIAYVKALPATILSNGLGQAMATLLAAAKGRAEDPHKRLYDHVSGWLCGDDPAADVPYPGADDLIKAITTNEEPAYLRAQAEALAYLTWLKKFAAAYLKAERP